MLFSSESRGVGGGGLVESRGLSRPIKLAMSQYVMHQDAGRMCAAETSHNFHRESSHPPPQLVGYV